MNVDMYLRFVCCPFASTLVLFFHEVSLIQPSLIRDLGCSKFRRAFQKRFMGELRFQLSRMHDGNHTLLFLLLKHLVCALVMIMLMRKCVLYNLNIV